MREFDLFDKQMVNFEEFLAENGLTAKFKKDGYPIEIEIRKAFDRSGQIGMFETDNDGKKENSRIVIRFPVGAVTVEFLGKISITEKLLNKIKSQAKKLHDLYLQGFFAMVTKEAEEDAEV